MPNDVTFTIATRIFSIYFALVKSTHTRIHTHDQWIERMANVSIESFIRENQPINKSELIFFLLRWPSLCEYMLVLLQMAKWSARALCRRLAHGMADGQPNGYLPSRAHKVHTSHMNIIISHRLIYCTFASIFTYQLFASWKGQTDWIEIRDKFNYNWFHSLMRITHTRRVVYLLECSLLECVEMKLYCWNWESIRSLDGIIRKLNVIINSLELQ